MPEGGGPLANKVAVVAGGSRNIGRGIAIELALAGADLWITGRTEGTEREPGSLRGTTAEIETMGGRARWVRCDHRDDRSVKEAFATVVAGSGPVDILVNNASPDFSRMVGRPFWELEANDMSDCLEIGPRSNFVTMLQVAGEMARRRSGLIVNISSHGSHEFVLSLPYGAGKAAIDKITHDAALELRAHNVCVLSLWPGFVRGREAGEGMEAVTLDPLFLKATDRIGESARFVGRAVVALATADDPMGFTDCSLSTRYVGDVFDLLDEDGQRPSRAMRFEDNLDEAEVPMLFGILEPYAKATITVRE